MILPGSLTLLLQLAIPTSISQQPEIQYTNPTCGIAFNHPAAWEVAVDSSDPRSSCRFVVRPNDWQRKLVADDSVDLYSISVEVAAGGLQQQLPGSSFRRHGAGWVVLGRQDTESPAHTIRGAGWTGVRGTATAGCYRLAGSYQGLCDQPTALAGTGKRSVQLVGGTQSEGVFDRLLATFRFLVGRSGNAHDQ